MTHRIVQLPLVNRFAELGEDYYTRVRAAPLPAPSLLHFNDQCAKLLDLDGASASDPDFLAVMAGNMPLPGGDALASVYAGHQFGVFVPQLGDGRALLIGQVRNARGELWELQLKGAGRTPYSRFADGRAVLRSSIREYLCSEAMHGLGIPTTRALCLVGSPEPVQRETLETAAVVCRVAPSFVRFGHFEYFYYQQRFDRLAPLADQVIEGHAPQFRDATDRHAAWLGDVVERTAQLMAHWQTVGFCHGVMNTDNFSILGLTLDYGPYGFMDGFESAYICNHSDEGGRYAYDQQPRIGYWNCSRLLQATLPLLHETPEAAVEIAQNILARYPPAYADTVLARWRAKLGLREAQENDRELVNQFLNILDRGHNDFTRCFRALAGVKARDQSAPAVRDEITDVAAFDNWLIDYRARLVAENSDDADRAVCMNAVNAKYVLRNHLVQTAIERAESGDISEVERLFRLLQEPFDEQPEFESYAALPPDWAKQISVSCSS